MGHYTCRWTRKWFELTSTAPLDLVLIMATLWQGHIRTTLMMIEIGKNLRRVLEIVGIPFGQSRPMIDGVSDDNRPIGRHITPIKFQFVWQFIQNGHLRIQIIFYQNVDEMKGFMKLMSKHCLHFNKPKASSDNFPSRWCKGLTGDAIYWQNVANICNNRKNQSINDLCSCWRKWQVQ